MNYVYFGDWLNVMRWSGILERCYVCKKPMQSIMAGEGLSDSFPTCGACQIEEPRELREFAKPTHLIGFPVYSIANIYGDSRIIAGLITSSNGIIAIDWQWQNYGSDEIGLGKLRRVEKVTMRDVENFRLCNLKGGYLIPIKAGEDIAA